MDTVLIPRVLEFISARKKEFSLISEERKAVLEELARHIGSKQERNQPVRLNFICTHNSRRSHLGQIWASVAAFHYSVERVATYSGGTEATAFNPNAVAALMRAGLSIRKGEGNNPKYSVQYAGEVEPLICFSKTFDDPFNPSSDFAAIMTCSDADEACPSVPGADFRIAVKYLDPKISDDTPDQESIYDERCVEIAREMLYTFSIIK